MTLRDLVLGRISFCIARVLTSRLLLRMRRNINLAVDVLHCTLFLLARGEKMHATHRTGKSRLSTTSWAYEQGRVNEKRERI